MTIGIITWVVVGGLLGGILVGVVMIVVGVIFSLMGIGNKVGIKDDEWIWGGGIKRMKEENKEGIPPVILPEEIRVEGHGSEMIRDTGKKKAGILIPQNLSEEEKAVLRDFYDL